MKQLLGVAGTDGFPLGMSEIPPYGMSSGRSQSPEHSFMQSLQRPAAYATQSTANINRHDNGSNPMQQLKTSQSFASLFGQGQQSANTSVLNNTNILTYPHTESKQLYKHSNNDDPVSAHLIYNSNFSGLESYGASGMTILEELTDLSLRVCENGRKAGQKHHSRGAALLTSNGKVYSGCDVSFEDYDPNGISAERAAVTAAVADGSSVFHCLVISTDTMTVFPAPDGRSREFLRSFGIFPIILVNCDLEMK